jgi:hypothetical protein
VGRPGDAYFGTCFVAEHGFEHEASTVQLITVQMRSLWWAVGCRYSAELCSLRNSHAEVSHRCYIARPTCALQCGAAATSVRNDDTLSEEPTSLRPLRGCALDHKGSRFGPRAIVE